MIARFGALPRTGSGRLRVSPPAELQREAVAAWRRSGESRESFGKRIGVSGQTLRNWERGATKPGVTKRPARPSKPTKVREPVFKPVTVVPEPQTVPSGRTFVLDLGRGARVTGLSLSDVARLLGTDERVRS